MKTEPLAAAAREITTLFKAVQQRGSDEYKETISEAERFQLWAVNVGLFDPDHESLDHRIREAAGLKTSLERFLESLRDSLNEGP